MATQKPDSVIPPYDVNRTIRFAVFGAAMGMLIHSQSSQDSCQTSGPVIGRWLRFLDHQFPLHSAARKARFVALGKRVLSDQTAMYVTYRVSVAPAYLSLGHHSE